MAKAVRKESILADGRLHHLPLHELHVDFANPRFGGNHMSASDEDKVVDEIIGQHGIVDAISSLAANGYFESEPLVGAINKGYNGHVTIIEGNRRLTACLVLAGDARAKRHAKIRAQYPKSKITDGVELPVQVYDWNDKSHRSRLLPYLGVRHIVGAQQWDSYAKAAWVVTTLEESEMSLDDIKQMIGDEQNFTDRIVEGYHFVRQLIDTNSYDPMNSLRKGRGSLQEFPFSWVYTALGYRSIREFVGLPKDFVFKEEPIKEDKLEDSAYLMQFMFGSSGKNAAIDDSRRIGSLAKALSHTEAITVLRHGGSIEDALDATRPPQELLLDLLGRSDKALADGLKVASGLPPLDRATYNAIQDATEKVDSRLDSLVTIIENLGPSARKRRRNK